MTASEQSALDTIRLLAEAQLNFGSRELNPDDNLWDQGMTSLTCLGLMLNIEDTFDVELPERLLHQSTFRSVNTILAAVESIRQGSHSPADASSAV